MQRGRAFKDSSLYFEPAFLTIAPLDAQPQELGLPTNAYAVVEQINEARQGSFTLRATRQQSDCTTPNTTSPPRAQADSGKTSKAFLHLPSTVGAFEAEEIGMEHLLRDVKDATISTLHTRVSASPSHAEPPSFQPSVSRAIRTPHHPASCSSAPLFPCR